MVDEKRRTEQSQKLMIVEGCFPQGKRIATFQMSLCLEEQAD